MGNTQTVAVRISTSLLEKVYSLREKTEQFEDLSPRGAMSDSDMLRLVISLGQKSLAEYLGKKELKK